MGVITQKILGYRTLLVNATGSAIAIVKSFKSVPLGSLAARLIVWFQSGNQSPLGL
jgi:hypothetical protein